MASNLHLLLRPSQPLPPSAAAPQQCPLPFSRQKLTPLYTTTFTPNTTSSSYSIIIKTPSSSSSSLRGSSLVASAIGPNLSAPLISPQDKWGNWTALLVAAAFGIWSEKTRIGSTLSGSLVSILVGLAASNLGIVASEAPAYDVVLQFLLPVAVPLLLFRADLRRVIKSTGTLLLAFLLGSGWG